MTDSQPVHPCDFPIEQLLRECDSHSGRRRGPGGQHRNKTESAVVLVHRPTGVSGQASERRSQAENRHQAVKRLRVNLALEIRMTDRCDELPSPLWRQRCPRGLIVINPEHADFPSLLAEALDLIRYRHAEVQHSAQQLGTTVSQLRKFLRLEPRAWTLVNDWCQQFGHPALS